MSIDHDWLIQNFSDLRAITALDQGGQKTVFAATHPTDGDVVLKIIRPGSDPRRTERERLAAEVVQSARVPRMLEYGVRSSPVGDVLWIREQRITGTSVRRCLQTKGPFPSRKLLKYALHTLEALVNAEDVNIVHRDVKPENSMCDDNENFWLLDFGLARHLDLHSLTATGAHGFGTLGYSPPEQFLNQKQNIDARTDLFALGITLYECATGVNPFRENTRDPAVILSRVKGQPLPLLSLEFPSANEFRDLVAAMTQKRVDQRPDSAKEALDWIREICETEQIY